ncbi:MAG: hypothetical protein H0Z33_14320 [Bacillaceae bacterium]|nr:hypothetical protein [Bacillaceae bacterium]
MDEYSGILFVALIVVGVYLVWRDNRSWIVIYEGTARTMGEAQRKFAYLKSRGVRCRLKTITPKTGWSQGATFSNPNMATTSRVLVHKQDQEKARRLLAEMET